MLDRRIAPGARTPGGRPEPAEPPVGIMPSGGLRPDPGGVAVSLPGFNFAPPGSIPVERSGAVTVVGGQTGEIIVFQLEQAQQLRIAEIGFSAMDAAGLVYASWAVLRDGAGLEGYNDIPVAIGTIDQPAQVDLQVPGPARITITVTNGLTNAGVVQVYVARMRGWRFNEGRK